MLTALWSFTLITFAALLSSHPINGRALGDHLWRLHASRVPKSDFDNLKKTKVDEWPRREAYVHEEDDWFTDTSAGQSDDTFRRHVSQSTCVSLEKCKRFLKSEFLRLPTPYSLALFPLCWSLGLKCLVPEAVSWSHAFVEPARTQRYIWLYKRNCCKRRGIQTDEQQTCATPHSCHANTTSISTHIQSEAWVRVHVRHWHSVHVADWTNKGCYLLPSTFRYVGTHVNVTPARALNVTNQLNTVQWKTCWGKNYRVLWKTRVWKEPLSCRCSGGLHHWLMPVHERAPQNLPRGRLLSSDLRLTDVWHRHGLLPVTLGSPCVNKSKRWPLKIQFVINVPYIKLNRLIKATAQEKNPKKENAWQYLHHCVSPGLCNPSYLSRESV